MVWNAGAATADATPAAAMGGISNGAARSGRQVQIRRQIVRSGDQCRGFMGDSRRRQHALGVFDHGEDGLAGGAGSDLVLARGDGTIIARAKQGGRGPYFLL